MLSYDVTVARLFDCIFQESIVQFLNLILQLLIMNLLEKSDTCRSSPHAVVANMLFCDIVVS